MSKRKPSDYYLAVTEVGRIRDEAFTRFIKTIEGQVLIRFVRQHPPVLQGQLYDAVKKAFKLGHKYGQSYEKNQNEPIQVGGLN